MNTSPTITNLKCIPLLETLYHLQEVECNELNHNVPQKGERITLPDGREGIFQRLWNEIKEDQWGNQRFSNDSFYRVSFEEDENGNLWTEELSDDMIKLVKYVGDAMNDDPGTPFILFDVSW